MPNSSVKTEEKKIYEAQDAQPVVLYGRKPGDDSAVPLSISRDGSENKLLLAIADIAISIRQLLYKIQSPDSVNPATGNTKIEAVNGTITTVSTVTTVTGITNIATIGSADTALNINAPLNNLLWANTIRANIS